MKRFSDFRSLTREGSTAVTIGNFDGVHRGHISLLDAATHWCEENGATVAVLTFDPHPARFLAPEFAPPLICLPEDKRTLLAQAGAALLLEQRFDRAFAELEPARFARDVLVDALAARHVVVGYDFSFGRGRAGNVETLRELGAELGFSVEIVGAQSVGEGLVASSTKVREFVLEGRMDGAALILGRPFHVRGTVEEGARRGRQLAFPTANLRARNELLPKLGVYATWFEYDGTPRKAVTNVGFHPTFEDAGLQIETFILDGEPVDDLYTLDCTLWFAARLRSERRFDSIDALRAQIARDVVDARAALENRPTPDVLRSPLGGE